MGKQLLMFHEKHDTVRFLVEDENEIYRVALIVFAARLRAGWYDDLDQLPRAGAERVVSDGDDYTAWCWLRMRSDQGAEYEGLTLTGFQGPNKYEV